MLRDLGLMGHRERIQIFLRRGAIPGRNLLKARQRCNDSSRNAAFARVARLHSKRAHETRTNDPKYVANANQDSGGSFESLDKMNSTNGQSMSWIVKVANPKIIRVQYWSKHAQEVKEVKRFQCVLTSADPKQYMYGCVCNHSVDEAHVKFQEGSVWKITRPVFDVNTKHDYVSCPIKVVVLMEHPTEMEKLSDPGNVEELKKWWPSGDIHVSISVSDAINALKQVRIPDEMGSIKTSSTALDVCGKIIERQELKTVKKNDGCGEMEVSDLIIGDGSGVSFSLSVCGRETHEQLADISNGTRVSLIGCNATKDLTTGDVKISLWPSVHVIKGGLRSDSLSQLSTQDAQGYEAVTTTSSATVAPIDISGQQAVPSSCTVLASVPEERNEDVPEGVVFQLDRVTVLCPTEKDLVSTESGGRLWVQIQASDWTGAVTLFVSHEAAPALFDCETAEEVLQRATDRTLHTVSHRVNMRGVIRFEDGHVRKFVLEVMKTPWESKISRMSMLLTKGIAGIRADLAMAAPMDRIQIDPLQGMCVVAEKGNGLTELQACVRLYLLVTGTKKTTCATLNSSTYMEDQYFRVCSPQAKCELSSAEMLVDLVGYCNFYHMPAFCLHNASAVVAISSLTKHLDGRLEATMEGMEPVHAASLKTIKTSFDLEWQTALSSAVSEPLVTCRLPESSDVGNSENCRAVSKIQGDPQTPRGIKQPGAGGE